jgi:hypothetical protein
VTRLGEKGILVSVAYLGGERRARKGQKETLL